MDDLNIENIDQTRFSSIVLNKEKIDNIEKIDQRKVSSIVNNKEKVD